MSPIISRARSATGAGAIIILILVLAFGNQAYVEWAKNHAQGANAWELLLRTLAWPQWFLTSGEDTPRSVLAFDLRALLLVVLVAAILGLAGPTVGRGFSTFAIGWFSVILGGAIAALVTAFMTSDASFYKALTDAGAASIYGLFTGWIVGLVTSAARRPAAVATSV